MTTFSHCWCCLPQLSIPISPPFPPPFSILPGSPPSMTSPSFTSPLAIVTSTEHRHCRSPFPSLPLLLSFSGSLLLSRHKFMAQCLSPDNWVSDMIAARHGSTVVAMADGGSRMPDDAISEVATVALASSMVLKGARGCTLALGMSLFGGPPWPFATATTKLHVAHPLTSHSEEEERQIDDGGFCCVSGTSSQELANEGDQQGCCSPTLTMILTTMTNKVEDATLAHTEVEEAELIAVQLI